MRISSTRDTDLFYVDWWLHNHNSHKASYEHDLLHCGNIGLPYLTDCKRFIDQVTLFAARQNKKVHISFTGGEVTEWIDFVELLEYAKNQGCVTRFTTNASADILILDRAFRAADSANIEVHPEYASVAHILIVLRLIADLPCSVSVNINMLPQRWQEMEDLYNKINAKYSNVSVMKKMLFDDPIFNTTPKDYTREQVVSLKTQTGDIRIEHSDHTEYTNFQSLVLEKRNIFKGYLCYAGIEQVIVDAWGRAHRGHCRKNGFMGTLKDPELYWYTDPFICKVDACVNQFDIQATKESFK